jgi:hypothetical protein
MYHSFGNHFERTQCYPLVTRLNWKLVLVHLEVVLILIQDRCTVCAKRTIGSEIVLKHPVELHGDVGYVESHFSTFGDVVSVDQDRCTVYAKLTIGSEIVLNVPDGTPRLSGSTGSSFWSIQR